tara:strand:+ start:767 stop:1453 length:687 start_codon:yes stop_codon:yes gene_type:complete
MTDTGTPADLASLEPLEPLEAQPQVQQDPMAHQRAGLAAPAFNMYCGDKTFYRFLFAGVIMMVGCIMPFSAEIGRAGYQTLAGGFYMLIAIAMIWSWWASIANNRPTGLKWLLFSMFPLIGGAWTMIVFDPVVAHESARSLGYLVTDIPFSQTWSDLFSDIGSSLAKKKDAPARVEGFWRLMGPGNVMIFLGALIAEAGFIMGVVGGAKQNKNATKQKQMKAAERRRK